VAQNEFPNGRNEREYRKMHAHRQAQETERGDRRGERETERERQRHRKRGREGEIVYSGKH
jgi:hypothetical protein